MIVSINFRTKGGVQIWRLRPERRFEDCKQRLMDCRGGPNLGFGFGSRRGTRFVQRNIRILPMTEL